MQIDQAHQLLATCADDVPRHDPDNPDEVLAMQIALNLPRQEPPARNMVLADAARAVATLCLEPRDEWVPALQSWYGARIRKVARRARNAAWDAVQELPGVSVGMARAFVPGEVGRVPKAIKKLQVKGTDLPCDEEPDTRTGCGNAAVILINHDLDMTLGKAAAQVGHAAMLLAAHRSTAWVRNWVDAGYPVVVREVDGAAFHRYASREGVVPVIDAGYTEVAPGSMTVLAADLPAECQDC